MIQLVMWYHGLLITVKNFIAQQIITEEDLEDLSSFMKILNDTKYCISLEWIFSINIVCIPESFNIIL